MLAMKMFNRKLSAIAFLALVLIGVLVGFWFAGNFQSSPASPVNTVLCPAVSYEFERPVGDIDIGKLLVNSYSDGEGTRITFNVFIDYYDENTFKYGGADCVVLIVNASASVPNGFIRDVDVVFMEYYEGSRIMFPGKYGVLSPAFFRWENLSPTSHEDWIERAGVKGYINFSGVNKPKKAFFRGPVEWALYGSNSSQTHVLSVWLKLTYYNGTDYLRVVLPIELTVWAEAGGNFETAREIAEGEYIGYSWVLFDPEDYYKIWVEDGKTIRVKVEPLDYPPAYQDFEVYLYNPERELVASAEEKEVDYTPEELNYTADVSGYWYIRIVKVRAGGGGLYRLTVSLKGEAP